MYNFSPRFSHWQGVLGLRVKIKKDELKNRHEVV